jgi:hypothetical protein
MSRIKRPSPALVVAILALVAAVAVPAFALTKKEKRVVRKIANAQITKRAPGLSVASANTANTAGNSQTANSAGNADTLDGQDATAFTPAGEVHSPGRFVLNDPIPGNEDSQISELLAVGPFTITGVCSQDFSGTEFDGAQILIQGPSGSSFSAVLSDGTALNTADNVSRQFTASSTGNEVKSGYMIAVAPSGEVVSVSASAEVNDPAGDCVFGATALGP